MIRTLALFLALSSATLATPIAVTDTTGKVLLGVDGIDVGGVLYDARFVDATFQDAFTTPDFLSNGEAIYRFLVDFRTHDEALAASTALLSAIDLFPQWDQHYPDYVIYGTGYPKYWRLYTPYERLNYRSAFGFSTYDVKAVGAVERATDDTFNLGTVIPLSNANTFPSDGSNVWVDWSFSPVPAPAPSSLWLFLFGVGLLVHSAIRKKLSLT